MEISMIRRIIEYFIKGSKFKKGDRVIIDKSFIEFYFKRELVLVTNYTYGVSTDDDSKFTGVVEKVFQPSDNKYMYLVRFDFWTVSVWVVQNNLSFLTKVDERDYKLEKLLS